VADCARVRTSDRRERLELVEPLDRRRQPPVHAEDSPLNDGRQAQTVEGVRAPLPDSRFPELVQALVAEAVRLRRLARLVAPRSIVRSAG
jgi:hypothetical protein